MAVVKSECGVASMLELDENKYGDDAEMTHILHRLQSYTS